MYFDVKAHESLEINSQLDYLEYVDALEDGDPTDYVINPLSFEIKIELDLDLTIMKRTRYNIWDLLADVGGFNDGLHLLVSFVFGGYSFFAF